MMVSQTNTYVVGTDRHTIYLNKRGRTPQEKENSSAPQTQPRIDPVTRPHFSHKKISCMNETSLYTSSILHVAIPHTHSMCCDNSYFVPPKLFFAFHWWNANVFLSFLFSFGFMINRKRVHLKTIFPLSPYSTVIYIPNLTKEYTKGMAAI